MNAFRDFLLGKGRHAPTPLLSSKSSRDDRSADGLRAVRTARTESRRSNQRRDDRHRLVAETAIVRRHGKEATVELVNVSGGGAMIRGKSGVKLWDHVELVLGEHGSIEAAVRWLRGDDAGLEFAHETRIECAPADRDELLRQVISHSFPEEGGQEPAPVEEAEQRRGACRHPLIWSGLILHNYESDPVRLRNISATGALIQSLTRLRQGSTVFLDLGEAGSLEATVCWCLGDQAGLSFHKPFDIRTLASLKPEVAPAKWTLPDYLADNGPESSPWASRWQRLTVDELRRSLSR